MSNRANISQAIARSRAARRALQSRRRRLTIAACAGAAAMFPLSLSLVGVTGTDVVHAAAAGAKSLSDLLNQRSPGERTAAQLTKTKHARAWAKKHFAVAPPDRLAIAPPVSGKGDFGDIAQLLIAPPAPTVDIAPPLSEIAINSSSPGAIIGSLPGGDVSTPGTGGGPVSFPKSEPHSPIPVAALPEPGTWAMMLVGFGLVGWRLRRSPTRRANKAIA